MNIRKLAIIAAMAVSVIFTATIAQAQAIKMGFIKEDRIRVEYKAFQKAEEQWNIESKAWDDEGSSKQLELQTMIDEYEKQKLILSEDKKKEREATLRAKKDALDAFTKTIFGPGGQAEIKQKMLLEPIYAAVNKAIEAVSIENGYDVVFTLTSIGYIKESYDVTDKVLEYLARQEQ
ncbi:MAG: OmpH family outer membrane protein [Candidatus Zixiibacteriota bacterium]